MVTARALLPLRQGEPACLDLGHSVSEAVIQRLKISREGVILIKSFEGFRPRAIRRDDGQWVIGYGHTLSAREGASVSEADAELLLQYDLIPVAKAVNDGVAASLNQHQFDALASFAFSVGVDRFQSSDVLSRLNAGFAGEAADALIGWPEPVLPETALRRRAADRALFVANPSRPIALADLLAAPLPPPVVPAPVDAAPEPESVETPAVQALAEPAASTDTLPEPEVPSEYVAPDLDTARSARHAAVASLLAEPAEVLRQPEPAEASPVETSPAEVAEIEAPALDAAEPETPEAGRVEPLTPEAPALEAPEVPAVATPTPTPAPPPAPAPAAFTAVQPMQRYSAYAGAIVGPLPAPILSPLAAIPTLTRPTPPAAPVAPAPVVSEPVAEAASEPAPEAGNPFVAPATETAAVETVAEAPAPTSADAQPTPWYVSPSAAGASPFPPRVAPADPEPPVEAGTGAGAAPEPFALAPEPAQPSPFDAPQPATPELPPLELPDFGASARPAPTPTLNATLGQPLIPTPNPWTAISATSEPRADGELLILNPSPEADVFASPRLVWPQGEQQGDETSPLFEDDGSLRLAPGNILRHEAFEDVIPARIPWGELTAYGVMGAFGLVSFGMSMAAFRKAAEASSGGDGVTLMAIVLAVIGAACVGVSAYNLYRRWGRSDED